MNQEQFQQLPMLVPLKLVKSVTGLRNEDIALLVARHEVRVFERPRRVYRRQGEAYEPSATRRLYFKCDVGRLVGFTT